MISQPIVGGSRFKQKLRSQPTPACHTRYINLWYCHRFLQNYPFFILLFSHLQYRYVHGRGNNGVALSIILRRLPAETAGSVWAPSLLDYVFLCFQATGTAHDRRLYGRGYGALSKGFDYRKLEGGEGHNNAYLLLTPSLTITTTGSTWR